MEAQGTTCTGEHKEWIGNAAAVLSGVWGAVTQRSEHSDYSRTAIYSHAQRVVEAVANEQATGVSYEALWAENEALWQVWSETETRSEAKQREFASADSAMGLSLTQIVVLLTIVLPVGRIPSRATVGRWVQHSQRQSHRILDVLDRACQRLVLVVCLDEIFLHRDPILMGVEPISLVWLAGHRGPDRSGESWCAVIEQWPHLEHVIADGGQGRERGVKLANEARRQAQVPEGAVPVSITMGLDVFHTQRELERVLQRLWHRVEGQIEAVKADGRLEQAKRRGQDPEGERARRVAPGERPRDSLMKRCKPKSPWSRSKGRCRGVMPRVISTYESKRKRNSTRRPDSCKVTAGRQQNGC